MQEEKIILIDGNSYLHRAYHALPPLTDAQGNMVNAVFGFLKMLKKLISDEQPTHIIVAFDHKKPTFRHKDFKEYKAHRPKADDELIQQFSRIREVLDALNMKHVSQEGFEADDIIATFTKQARKEDIFVSIVTADKDALQLVKDKVKVVNGMKRIEYDSETVKEKIGVTPEQMAEYLALIGDKSDNLPGVRGIGPVTAVKLLSGFKNLEGIYSNLDSIKQSVRAKLEQYKEDAFTTRRLVRLVEDMDLPFGVKEGLWKGPDPVEIKKQLNELNFKSLLSDWIEKDELKGKINSRIITGVDDLEEYLENNAGSGEVIMEFVFISNNTAFVPDNLVGIGMSFDGENNIYLPFGHRYLGIVQQLKWADTKNLFEKYIIGKKMDYTVYDFKNIYKFFKNQGIYILNPVFDIITANYVLDASEGEKSLKDISSRYMDWIPEEIGSNPENIEMEKAAAGVSGRLAAVFKLKKALAEKIIRQSADKLYYQVEIPMLKILAEMELTGIRLNRIEMEKTHEEFRKELSQIEKDIFTISGEKFNLNSSQQLAELLFNKIGLKPIKKTKTGYSTAEDVLYRLANQHPLPSKIIEYRKLQKLISTYVEPLCVMADPDTLRIHTTFHIAGTATGRLSSSEPNLQNIPVKTKQGRLIRRAFIPDEGKVLLSADYSQIDLRLLAHISGDQNLIGSFNSGEDIHTRTAAGIFDISESEVTPELRKKAKAINFGIVYGMSSWGLSKRIEMSEEESQVFIRKYFDQYPGIRNYMKEIVSKAKKDEYVSTILNRRRYLPEINSLNHIRRKLFERIAINTPIQGSSADVIKLAMVELNKEFLFNQGEMKLLLQIHDELLFEIPYKRIDEIKEKIKGIMEGSAELNIPLVVDFKMGENWMDFKPC